MKKNKKRILITGVSGLLGNNFGFYFRDKNTVLGIYNSHPVCIEGIGLKKIDIVSDDLSPMMGEFRPDIVIHCASLTNIDYCEENKELADQVNVLGTKRIRDSLRGNETKLIYISTESVYACVKGNASEGDPIDPPNYYGLTKYRGEQEALQYNNTLIARTTLFGWNICDKFSLAEWVLDALLDKKQIGGFTDIDFSPIYTFELAKLLDMAIAQDLKGVYNFGGSGFMTKYDFACLIAQRFKLDASLVKPVSVNAHAFRARRGRNLSLSTNKLANALGVSVPTIEECIDLFLKDYHNGILQKMNSAHGLAHKGREANVCIL
jgi:dTDP-4-dehydrorhamnose reductase